MTKIRSKQIAFGSTTPSTGDSVVFSGTELVALKNQLTAGTPTVTDDSAAGYAVRSRWIDTNTGVEYLCADATEGAAVWNALGGPGVTTYATESELLDTPTSAGASAYAVDTDKFYRAVGDAWVKNDWGYYLQESQFKDAGGIAGRAGVLSLLGPTGFVLSEENEQLVVTVPAATLASDQVALVGSSFVFSDKTVARFSSRVILPHNLDGSGSIFLALIGSDPYGVAHSILGAISFYPTQNSIAIYNSLSDIFTNVSRANLSNFMFSDLGTATIDNTLATNMFYLDNEYLDCVLEVCSVGSDFACSLFIDDLLVSRGRIPKEKLYTPTLRVLLDGFVDLTGDTTLLSDRTDVVPGDIAVGADIDSFAYVAKVEMTLDSLPVFDVGQTVTTGGGFSGVLTGVVQEGDGNVILFFDTTGSLTGNIVATDTLTSSGGGSATATTNLLLRTEVRLSNIAEPSPSPNGSLLSVGEVLTAAPSTNAGTIAEIDTSVSIHEFSPLIRFSNDVDQEEEARFVLDNVICEADTDLVGALFKRTQIPTGTINPDLLAPNTSSVEGQHLRDPATGIEYVFNGSEYVNPAATSDELIGVSASDTNPDYLGAKLLAGPGVQLSVEDPSGDAKLRVGTHITVGAGQLYTTVAAALAAGYDKLFVTGTVTDTVATEITGRNVEILLDWDAELRFQVDTTHGLKLTSSNLAIRGTNLRPFAPSTGARVYFEVVGGAPTMIAGNVATTTRERLEFENLSLVTAAAVVGSTLWNNDMYNGGYVSLRDVSLQMPNIVFGVGLGVEDRVEGLEVVGGGAGCSGCLSLNGTYVEDLALSGEFDPAANAVYADDKTTIKDLRIGKTSATVTNVVAELLQSSIIGGREAADPFTGSGKIVLTDSLISDAILPSLDLDLVSGNNVANTHVASVTDSTGSNNLANVISEGAVSLTSANLVSNLRTVAGVITMGDDNAGAGLHIGGVNGLVYTGSNNSIFGVRAGAALTPGAGSNNTASPYLV